MLMGLEHYQCVLAMPAKFVDLLLLLIADLKLRESLGITELSNVPAQPDFSPHCFVLLAR